MKLTDISGVGESKARVLRDAGYGTAGDLRRATQNELADIEDIGAALAARIKADVGDLSDGEAESAIDAGNDAGDESAIVAEDDAGDERDSVSVDPAWRFRYGDTISGAIASDGETIYIGGKSSVFYAVDAATGQRRWEFRTGGELWSRPVVAGGTVYVETDKLYALDAVSGEERWRAPAGNPPAVAGDTVYVTDSDGTLYARDARTGEERWRTDLGWVEQPVVADRTVYVNGGSELIPLETENGRERWRFEAADRVYTPTIDGWSVYVGSADNSLYGLAEGPDPRHRRAFERGEKLLYGGQRYPLRVAESPVETPRVTFDGAHFILRVPRDDASPTARRDAVLDWYRDHARDVIPACAAAVAPADPPPVDVGAPDRRWVCDAGDRLLAHWRLVFLPRPVAAYAVAHALVGRQYDPSAPAFWTALDARVPNARSRGDWLRQNGARLRL